MDWLQNSITYKKFIYKCFHVWQDCSGCLLKKYYDGKKCCCFFFFFYDLCKHMYVQRYDCVCVCWCVFGVLKIIMYIKNI